MFADKYGPLRKGIVFCAYVLLSGCTGEAVMNSSEFVTSSSVISSEIAASSQSSEALASSNVTISANSSSQASSVDMTGGVAYQNADGIKGGQLYAQFWATETGFTVNNSELVNAAQLEAIKQKPIFFACTHCHGWDRLGQLGGNSNLAPNAERPRVADLDLAKLAEISSPQALFEGIKFGVNRRSVNENLADYSPTNNAEIGDSMPAYSRILTNAQIWDVVKFLKEEALDTTALYQLHIFGSTYPRSRGFSNFGVEGSDVAGKELFAGYCAGCHGSDGTALLLDGGILTLGKYMRNKPFVAQHKVKFGHLGSIMGPVLKDASLDDIQDLFAAIADSNSFPDVKSEPEPEPDPEPEPEPEPIDGRQAFLIHCSSCHTGNGAGSGRSDVTGATADQINRAIQTVPRMAHLKPDDPVQFATLEEIDAIAEFLKVK